MHRLPLPLVALTHPVCCPMNRGLSWDTTSVLIDQPAAGWILRTYVEGERLSHSSWTDFSRHRSRSARSPRRLAYT